MPHFEIHATDPETAREFYAELLGWSFTPMQGGEDLDYHLINGPGIGDENSLTGGMMARLSTPPLPGSPVRGGTMTFEVANCDRSYAWALDHGGAEALPPTDYPGIGRCAYVEDGQGNIVGLITPAEGEN